MLAITPEQVRDAYWAGERIPHRPVVLVDGADRGAPVIDAGVYLDLHPDVTAWMRDVAPLGSWTTRFRVVDGHPAVGGRNVLATYAGLNGPGFWTDWAAGFTRRPTGEELAAAEAEKRRHSLLCTLYSPGVGWPPVICRCAKVGGDPALWPRGHEKRRGV